MAPPSKPDYQGKLGGYGPDGMLTHKHVPNVIARLFPLGQRETGQKLHETSKKPEPEVASGKETDPAGQY